MNAMSFFDKITQLRRTREEQQIGEYAEIVSAVAIDCEKTDPHVVDRVISEAGKSLEEFTEDVSKLRRRMKLHELASSLPVLQKEKAGIETQLKMLDAEFDATEKQYEADRRPLEDCLRTCADSIREANKARSELVATCEDPVLLGEMQHVESEIERLAEINRSLLSQAVYYEDQADTERRRADQEIGEGDRNHRIEHADSYLKEAKSIRQRIKENEKACEKLQRQRSEIEERMQEQ